MEGESGENQAHRGTALRDKPVLTDTDACVYTYSVDREASTYPDSKAEVNGQNLVAELTVIDPCLEPESTISDPCLESAVSDPCLDSESAVSHSCLDPESAVSDPCLDPESAVSDPCLHPESAVSDLCLDPEPSVSDPCLESAVSDPCLDPESSVSDPCLHSASPTRSSALSFSDRPPDGGWGWVIVAAALACHTLLEGFPRALGVLFQPTIRVFGGNNAETAVHQSIFNTLRMVLGK